MKPSMSPRFHAATCASSTARMAAIAFASRLLVFDCLPYMLSETVAVNERAMMKSKRRFIYSSFTFRLDRALWQYTRARPTASTSPYYGELKINRRGRGGRRGYRDLKWQISSLKSQISQILF